MKTAATKIYEDELSSFDRVLRERDEIYNDDSPGRLKKTLIEIKLASGMTGKGRLQDLADVQRLMEVNKLSRTYAQELDEFVRVKFWNYSSRSRRFLAKPLECGEHSPLSI